MNIKSVIVLAALSAAASIAFAQERVPDVNDAPAFVSSKTRAEVRAETDQARRDGSLQALQSDHYTPPFASMRSREDVRAQASSQRQRRVFDTTTAYDNRG